MFKCKIVKNNVFLSDFENFTKIRQQIMILRTFEVMHGLILLNNVALRTPISQKFGSERVKCKWPHKNMQLVFPEFQISNELFDNSQIILELFSKIFGLQTSIKIWNTHFEDFTRIYIIDNCQIDVKLKCLYTFRQWALLILNWRLQHVNCKSMSNWY